MWVHIPAHTRAHTYNTCTHRYKHARMHACLHAHKHRHARTQTRTHTNMHASTHARTDALKHAHTQKHVDNFDADMYRISQSRIYKEFYGFFYKKKRHQRRFGIFGNAPIVSVYMRGRNYARTNNDIICLDCNNYC